MNRQMNQPKRFYQEPYGDPFYVPTMNEVPHYQQVPRYVPPPVDTENYDTHFWRMRNKYMAMANGECPKNEFIPAVYYRPRKDFVEPSGMLDINFNHYKTFANEEMWRIASILTKAYYSRDTFRSYVDLSRTKRINVIRGFHEDDHKGIRYTHFNITISVPPDHFLHKKPLHVIMDKHTTSVDVFNITTVIDL
jgi:hypothetical protein